MHRFVAAVVLGVSALATSACLQVEQTLTLERDLSGKAGFAMNLDMESLVPIMAAFKKSMDGKGTVPTAAELAEARKELLANQKTEKKDLEQEKKEFESQLPAGVKLIDAQAKEDGLKVAASFLLGFDQVSKLSQVKFPKSGDKADAMGGTNPVESPFGGLKVVTEGQTILITTPVDNPLADQQEKTSQMPMDAAVVGLVQQLFKGVRMSFKITAPFEVVEHNAHRREGTTLIWDYDLTNPKITPDQMKQGVRVRFRR